MIMGRVKNLVKICSGHCLTLYLVSQPHIRNIHPFIHKALVILVRDVVHYPDYRHLLI